MKLFHFQNLPKWLQSNVFYRAKLKTDSGDPDGFSKKLTEVHPLDANLISSEKANGKHVLMLDLDQKSFITDSSTGQHRHVYIDADLDLDALKEIVDVLAKHGILQQGIKKQLESSNCLTFRPPGVTKGVHEDSIDVEEYKAFKQKEVAAAKSIEQIQNEIVSTFAIDGPIIASKKTDFKDNIINLKQHLTKKSSKDYYYKSVIAITVAEPAMQMFLKSVELDLGLESGYLFIKEALSADYTLQYKGHVIAKVSYDYQAMVYGLEFRKEFIEFAGASTGGVPSGWPDWDRVYKVISKHL